MFVDWFTIAAQAANFLVLVVLLKRFLYKPILAAIDERERGIAQQLQDAQNARDGALKERADFEQKDAALLRAGGALDYCVVIVTEGSDASGLTYLAPYAATSIAEYFAERGRDVLIVYDDLTRHARAYRELSLLLRRPPGREAFPGDIFYIHSRLLERSTQLGPAHGGGSLTAFPIIETEAQNLSAYIPTNLISITDGQIYLSPTLFELGVLPAVDVGRSVSRVGGKAQLAALRAVAGPLKLGYAQFEELEAFARFGARLDDHTHAQLEHGRRIRACLKQAETELLPADDQVCILLALTEHLFDGVALEKMREAQGRVRAVAGEVPRQLREHLLGGAALTDEERGTVVARARAALAGLGDRDG